MAALFACDVFARFKSFSNAANLCAFGSFVSSAILRPYVSVRCVSSPLRGDCETHVIIPVIALPRREPMSKSVRTNSIIPL